VDLYANKKTDASSENRERQTKMEELDARWEKLQVRADQNRIDFLRAELALSFTFAGLAETKFDSGHLEEAQYSVANAESAYSTVLRFLSDPKHAKHIAYEERRHLRTDLDRLRETIERLKQRC
jgi:hypothetical protein